MPSIACRVAKRGAWMRVEVLRAGNAEHVANALQRTPRLAAGIGDHGLDVVADRFGVDRRRAVQARFHIAG
jgi:hypothetical protein